MSYLIRNAILLAKLETNYGEDAAPAGANAILVRNLNPTPQQSEFASRDLIRPYFGNSEQLPAAIAGQLEFEVELQGSGTPGLAPGWGPVLRACAFSETITADTSVVYAPISSGFESVTLYYSLGSEEGGRLLHRFRGARGTVSFAVDAKGIPVMKFRFLGLYSPVEDSVAALAPDFSLFKTPLPANTVNTPAFSLHGVSSPLSNFSLDVANTLVHRALIGGESVKITDRKAAGSLSFSLTPVATKNWWEIARNATLGTLHLRHGATAGAIVEFDSARVQLSNPQYQDENGEAMLQMSTAYVPSSAGDDEFTLTVR